MATQPTYPAHVTRPDPAGVPATLEPRPGILDRWRAARDERKQARLISARNRRVLARWARRTANRTNDPHPFARRRQALLNYRVAAVRTDLLEIAALLERAHDPNPACVAALRNLLANGCDSPLYNPDIHPSELHATLYYLRSSL